MFGKIRSTSTIRHPKNLKLVFCFFALFLLVLPAGCYSRQENEGSAISDTSDELGYRPLAREDAALAFSGDAMNAAVQRIHSAAGDGIDTAHFSEPFLIPTVCADGAFVEDDTQWVCVAYDDERLYAFFFVFFPEAEGKYIILPSTAGIGTINRLLERTGERELRLVSLPGLPGTTTDLCYVDADGRVFPIFRKDPEDRAPVTVGYLPALTPQLVLPAAAQGLF